MYLEIVTPEAVLFSGEVTSVAVPGADGEFQMLDNHAPILSSLVKGSIKVYGDINPEEEVADKFSKGDNGATHVTIESGVIEMKDNKIIILAD